MHRVRFRRVAALLGVLAVAAVAVGVERAFQQEESSNKPVESAATPGSNRSDPKAPGTILWGAWIGDQRTGSEAPQDMQAVVDFERTAGKGLSVLNFSAPFADCATDPCRFYPFAAAEFEAVREYGAIPFFSWASQSTPASLDQPDFQLADLISGAHDDHIRRFAEGARDWGHPFFLRFNWEMNGNWFAWMEGVNGNEPGESVTAWRHVHEIFDEVGADNATWVWCPNVDPLDKLHDLAALYPGDAYVDWTCLDGYNWGTNPARPHRWRTFNQLFRDTYEEITERIAPGKSLIVGEVGTSEYGGSKAVWIEDMLTAIPTEYPRIRGLVYFDKYDDEMDWPLASSAAAVAAFASGIRNPVYAGNDFADLPPSPIQPAG